MTVLIRYTLLFSTVLLSFSACENSSPDKRGDDMSPEAIEFISGRFENEISAGLHYREPGNCFRQIKRNIPQAWWRYAVEALYYNIPEARSTSDSIRYWLDTAQIVLPDKNVRSFLQMIRGNRYVEQADYSSALSSMQESYDLAMECDQPCRANDAKRYMAQCLMYKGDYPRAIAVLLEVNEFFSDKNYHTHQVRKFEIKLQLARAFQTSGDNERALYWGKQAFDFAPEQSGQKIIAAEFMTQIFLNRSQPDSAWITAQYAATSRRAYIVHPDSAHGHYLTGKTLTELKRYNEALPKLQLAISSNLDDKNPLKISDMEAALADCYYGMGQTARALEYYLKALNITPDTSRMSAIHYKIADIYEKTGLPQKALYHLRQGANCFRIFFNNEKHRTIGRIESQAALDRETNQVRILKEQQKVQQFRFTTLVLMLLLISVSLFFHSDRQRRKKNLLEKENELLEAHQLIQKQELMIASASLTEKKAEVAILQNLLELKNQLITTLEQQIPARDESGIVTQPLRMITDLDWQEFRDNFEKQFPNYISRLKSTFFGITNTEIRLFIFIKLGLESQQIANISGISPESVYRNRSRLRQKLDLDPDVNLDLFIKNF